MPLEQIAKLLMENDIFLRQIWGGVWFVHKSVLESDSGLLAHRGFYGFSYLLEY